MRSLTDLLRQMPRYPVAPPRPPEPDHWKPASNPRDLPSLSDLAFLPKNRGSIQSIRVPTDVVDLASPRPLSYLRGLRSVAKLPEAEMDRLRASLAPGQQALEIASCSAQDHAVLEILVSAAYEQDPSMRAGGFTVPVAAVLAILGLPHHRLRDLRASLERLATRLFELPAWEKAKRRSRRLVSDLPKPPPEFRRDGRRRDRWEILVDAMRARGADEGAINEWMDEVERFQELALDARDEAYPGLYQREPEGFFDDPEANRFRRACLEQAERDFGVFWRPTEKGELVEATKPPRSLEFGWIGLTLEGVVPAIDPPYAVSMPVDDGHVFRFTPIWRWDISMDGAGGRREETLHFQLATPLVRSIDRTRFEGGRASRYAYLDLNTMCAFTSRYSAPLYRRVCAESLETTTFAEFQGARRTDGRFDPRRRLRTRVQPRYGEWTLPLTVDELAETTGYVWVRGGRASQLRRGVVEPVMRDLRKTGIDHHGVRLWIDDEGEVRCRVTSMTPMLRFPKASDYEISMAHFMPKAGATRQDQIESAMAAKRRREILSPDQDRRYAVHVETWLRVAKRLSLQGYGDLRRYAVAWQRAIEEMLCEGIGHFGDLTGVLGRLRDPASSERAAYIDQHGEAAAAIWLDMPVDATPRLRGRRLAECLTAYGPDRTAFRFALEEAANPDLTLPHVELILGRDGTDHVVAMARRNRLDRNEVGHEIPLGDRIRGVPEDALDLVRAAMAAHQSRDATPTEQLIERREERRVATAKRYNLRRRIERAKAKEVREIAQSWISLR